MADSVTTQQVDVEKLLAEADAIIANIRQKLAAREPIIANIRQERAEREAKRKANEKLLAEARAIVAKSQLKRAESEAHKKLLPEANYTMADSGTTQYARIKKLLDSSDAILTNIQLKRDDGEELDEAEWEEAIAEVKRLHREAREKLFARVANSQREAKKKAKPFLTTSQWLSAIFIAASLAGF